MTEEVGLCFWNMLADGLALDEFSTWGGDDMLTWAVRSAKVFDVLAEGLSKCAIFAVVECDRAVQLYQRLLPDFPDLHALWVIGARATLDLPSDIVFKVEGVSNARAISVSKALSVASAAGCAGLPDPPPSSKQLKDMPASEVSAIVHTISLALSSNPSLAEAFIAARLHAQTWLNEANGDVEVAARAAAAYGADINDLAFSDDGTCIFWRGCHVQLVRSSLSSLPLNMPLPAFSVAAQNKGAVFCCWSKAGMRFVTAAAHFPSGENVAEFSRRHAFTQQLFSDYALFCSGIMPPPHGVLLCDSNESSDYEAQFIAQGGSIELTLSHALSHHGLLDFASSDNGARCLKLRHARGQQVHKLGALMFDRIDCIIMHPRLAAAAASMSFERFVRYPLAISDDVLAVRTNPEARNNLREWVKQANLGPDMNQTSVPDQFSFLRHLYPSSSAPSDHPPLGVSISLPVTIFASASEVLRYWFGPLHAPPQPSDALQPAPSPPLDTLKERMGYWYARSSASFDEAQHMSLGIVHAAAAGLLSGSPWEGPEGALAKLILLDQFPRCIFRGSRYAFQYDTAVLQLVKSMKSHGWLQLYDTVQLFFVGVAAQHSESSDGQQLGLDIASVVLQCNPLELRNFFQSLTGYPHEHAEVFSKFGRFPGRNAAIGRPSTPQELEWLSHPDCPSWCKSQTAVAPSADVLPPVHQDYPHALQSFPLAFAQHRNAAEFVAQAVKAAEAGLYCEAEQLFMRALALEDTAKAREMCAQVAMENDCPEAAIEHAVRAAVLQPAWPAAFITLGRACRNAGKLGRSSAAFATALSLLADNDEQVAEVESERREVLQLLETLSSESRR